MANETIQTDTGLTVQPTETIMLEDMFQGVPTPSGDLAESLGLINNFEGAVDLPIIQRHMDLFGMDEPKTREEFLNTLSPSGTLSGLLGIAGEDARREAEAAQLGFQAEALNTLLRDLEPFRQAGLSQLDSATALATSPAGQMDFLQNNPLFNMLRGGAENIVGGIIPGKDVSSGLEASFLAQGNNLIDQQLNRQIPLLNIGQASAAQTGIGGADLTSGFGDIKAAAAMADQQAQAQGGSNIMGLVGAIASFSDERLKEDVYKVGKFNGLNVYTWRWNDEANDIGLEGHAVGHIAQEVQKVYPELVQEKDGYFQVLYGVPGKTMEAV